MQKFYILRTLYSSVCIIYNWANFGLSGNAFLSDKVNFITVMLLSVVFIVCESRITENAVTLSENVKIWVKSLVYIDSKKDLVSHSQ